MRNSFRHGAPALVPKRVRSYTQRPREEMSGSRLLTMDFNKGRRAPQLDMELTLTPKPLASVCGPWRIYHGGRRNGGL